MTTEQKIKLIKKIAHPIIVLIMLPSALMLIVIPFMFDAPGSESKLPIIVSAISIPAFLVSGILAIFLTDKFVKKSKINKVYLLNALPFVILFIFFLVNFLG